jgi:CheY-like chemotaxis protein
MLSELLAEEGYAVVCTENGRDALDYLSRSNTVPDPFSI